MFVDATTNAAKAFLSKLPEEMVILALEAVELQEHLDGVTDKRAHDDIQRQLELINRRIIQSATRVCEIISVN